MSKLVSDFSEDAKVLKESDQKTKKEIYKLIHANTQLELYEFMNAVFKEESDEKENMRSYLKEKFNAAAKTKKASRTVAIKRKKSKVRKDPTPKNPKKEEHKRNRSKVLEPKPLNQEIQKAESYENPEKPKVIEKLREYEKPGETEKSQELEKVTKVDKVEESLQTLETPGRESEDYVEEFVEEEYEKELDVSEISQQIFTKFESIKETKFNTKQEKAQKEEQQRIANREKLKKRKEEQERQQILDMLDQRMEDKYKNVIVLGRTVEVLKLNQEKAAKKILEINQKFRQFQENLMRSILEKYEHSISSLESAVGNINKRLDNGEFTQMSVVPPGPLSPQTTVRGHENTRLEGIINQLDDGDMSILENIDEKQIENLQDMYKAKSTPLVPNFDFQQLDKDDLISELDLKFNKIITISIKELRDEFVKYKNENESVFEKAAILQNEKFDDIAMNVSNLEKEVITVNKEVRKEVNDCSLLVSPHMH